MTEKATENSAENSVSKKIKNKKKSKMEKEKPEKRQTASKKKSKIDVKIHDCENEIDCSVLVIYKFGKHLLNHTFWQEAIMFSMKIGINFYCCFTKSKLRTVCCAKWNVLESQKINGDAVQMVGII